MGTRDGLEAALLASWDRETLAVYADHLQAAGDPRGELIALDLELASRSTPELVARRTSLLTGWLGALVPSNPHTPWIGDSFRLGFVEELVLDEEIDAEVRLAQMLASPLAAYIKRVTILGAAAHAGRMLAALATHTHPWLTELAVRATAPGPVDAAIVQAIIEATPALQQLEVVGHDVFAAFPHPHVSRLRLTGATALPGVFAEAASMTAVREIDLAFATERGALGALRLPALRVLDLSRNEPEAAGYPYDAYDDDAYDDDDGDPEAAPEGPPGALAMLATQPVRRQLTRLRLPSLRTHEELERLQVIVAQMPALEEVEVVRAHYLRLPAKLAGTEARFIRPAGWPWPPPAELPEGDMLAVEVPGSFGEETVLLADAAAAMERRFEGLDADARYAWTRFWAVVDELGRLAWKTTPHDPHRTWTDQRTLPAALLVQALGACDVGGSNGWRELREVLRSRAPFARDAVLTLHRTRRR